MPAFGLFAFEATGPASPPDVAVTRPILASLALGRDASSALYVADLAGTLYALDRATGAVRWTFEVGRTISSSPAVSTGGRPRRRRGGRRPAGRRRRAAHCPPADDGTPVLQCGVIYAITDMGSAPEVKWSRLVPAQIGNSSPVDSEADGTVYIGGYINGQTGVLFYEIAAAG